MPLKQKLYCNSIGCKMAYAVKGIMRMLNKRFKEQEIELTLEQYFILNILDNEEGLILQDLAEIVDRDKSSVLRHIDGLEQHHFVVRTKDPEDRRRKILIVTKPGIQALEEARFLEEEVNDEVLQNINTKELKKLRNQLSQIYERTC